MIKKVISGGQTGVDQAALQAAIDSGLEHGGWCPPERVCEDGIIPDHFHLQETPIERDPTAPEIPRSQRTIWNVRDSDGSLIFWGKEVTKLQKRPRNKFGTGDGTKLALDVSEQLSKPAIIVNPFDEGVYVNIKNWIEHNSIEILCVGGPSEASSPGIYNKVYRILKSVLSGN